MVHRARKPISVLLIARLEYRSKHSEIQRGVEGRQAEVCRSRPLLWGGLQSAASFSSPDVTYTHPPAPGTTSDSDTRAPGSDPPHRAGPETAAEYPMASARSRNGSSTART